MASVLTIGDGIVDLIRIPGAPEEWHAGGAALNHAVGISRLGHRSTLASRIGADRNGFRVMRHLRDEGVRLINMPSADFTGVAISERDAGEPRYTFNAPIHRRRLAFAAPVLDAMATADVVVVSNLTFEDRRQAEGLVAARKAANGLFVLDPNPRPSLLRDVDAYRQGLEANLPGCFLLKLSVEDVELLYGAREDDAIGRLRSSGARHVVLTRGRDGASAYAPGLDAVHVGATVGPDEIVDTMGAGDAALAATIDWLARRGVPADREAWRACLESAMRIAGATCTRNGGGLVRR